MGCSSDKNDPISEETLPSGPVIDGFKNSYSGDPIDPSGSTVNSYTTGVVENNQILRVVEEDNTLIEYTYNAANLVEKYFKFFAGERNVKDYFYDNQNRLIGINWSIDVNAFRFYRISYPSGNTCYFELISLPYDDPNTELGIRRILKFDNNDNIIEAGEDSDLDGNIDEPNIFNYDSQGNLMSGQIPNGENFSISYSSIIDTESYLEDKTFGKKMLRILNAEIYASNNPYFLLKDNEHSYNITLEESLRSSYETLENNFFFKRTKISNENPNLIQTYTLEYTFQQ
jgi:hypothetical protein